MKLDINMIYNKFCRIKYCRLAYVTPPPGKKTQNKTEKAMVIYSVADYLWTVNTHRLSEQNS